MGCGGIGPRDPFATTLVESLTGTVDSLRQIYTSIGLRPQRVALVWLAWGGHGNVWLRLADDLTLPEQAMERFVSSDLDPDRIGVGAPSLVCEYELLPTPLVSGIGGVGKDQDATGNTERGGVTVSQVSARYSEDFLMGLIAPFRRLDRPDALVPGVEFFWELREDRRAGWSSPGVYGAPESTQDRAPPRRRFHVSAVPEREPERFQWVVALTRADGERGRDGEVDEVG